MARQYPNPPLTEAVCEFRFQDDASWDPTVPGRLYERLRHDFPKHQAVGTLETSISVQPLLIQQQVRPLNQSQFLREDGTALVQVGPNLLAINHLRPYPGWATFLPIIADVLAKYREVAEPRGLQRIGLRYVNRFLFEGPRVELEDFFDFYPYVGPNLPQDYALFMVGIHVSFDEHGDAIRIQLNDADGDRPGEVAFILDFDYFLNRPGEVGLDSVDSWLEQAHQRIEEVFEGCIKTSLRERFFR